MTIRARQVIDGRGGAISNAHVSIKNGKIVSVGPASGTPTIDLGNLTLLPGFIDTHVHIGWHFDDKGRYHSGPEPADQAALYGAENAYVTLIAGFTTVQSVGAASDKPLRDAINRGVLPGPRILSSLGQISNPKWTPDQIREQIRKLKADGADLIKIFASASIRDGGVPTLSQEQVDAACGEARAQGLRSMVHAHSPESMLRAARAKCTVVEHGGLANAEALKALADGGVYFDPNIGLVTQNYLENKARFLGIGNYTEEGFASMEKALGLRGPMFSTALKTAGPEDRDGHRRGRRRARPERARADRARQGRPEADGRDRRHDLAGGAVDESRQGARRDRRRPQRRSRRDRRRSASGHHRAAARSVRDA